MASVSHVACCTVLGVALGAPALAQPRFTVANGGPSGLQGRHLYRQAGGVPLVAFDGAGFGCTNNQDDLVAISARKVATQFIACSSVDPTSVGQFQGPPPPFLPPYSVWDQSGKRQHAGDLWMMSKAFDRATGIIPAASLPVNQMYLAVNQAAPWTAYFGLLPNGGPDITFPHGTLMDDVDGVLPEPGVPKIYFCLKAGSPSLPGLVGANPSGADIVHDTNPLLGGLGTESVFAKAADLGLLVGDQIDGLMVYDDQDDGVFDDVDTVIFSLGRLSPSLTVLGATAADMLVVTHGTDATPQIFATADNWGLGPNDNIDDLDGMVLQNFSAYQTLLAAIGNPDAKSVANGPIETDAYKGIGQTDASALQFSQGLNVFGFGHSAQAQSRVADDFEIPVPPGPVGPAMVTGFSFLAYQTNSGPGPSPFQQYIVGIWSKPPVEGGRPDVLPYTKFAPSNPDLLQSKFASIHRVPEGNLLDGQRPVFENICTLQSPLRLQPGTYWLDWQAVGSPAFGDPSVPPVTLKNKPGKLGANALQLINQNWIKVIDTGPANAPQDLPFRVEYLQQSVPPLLCYPDCDGDGVLSISDFICFQTSFALNEPYADCDGSGQLAIDDFICFQTYFAIGCED